MIEINEKDFHHPFRNPGFYSISDFLNPERIADELYEKLETICLDSIIHDDMHPADVLNNLEALKMNLYNMMMLSANVADNEQQQEEEQE